MPRLPKLGWPFPPPPSEPDARKQYFEWVDFFLDDTERSLARSKKERHA